MVRPSELRGRGDEASPRATESLLIAGSSAPDALKVVAAIDRHEKGRFKLLGFLDVDEARVGSPLFGLPVWDQREVVESDFEACSVFVNVGRTMALRQSVVEDLRRRGFKKFASLVHPDVDLWEVEYREGCIIMQGCLIGPMVKIGAFSQLLMGANINHDVALEEFSFVGPNVTILGTAHIGKGAYIGGGVTILPGVRVGAWSCIGAGAVVTHDVESGTVVAGVPARKLRIVDRSQVGK